MKNDGSSKVLKNTNVQGGVMVFQENFNEKNMKSHCKRTILRNKYNIIVVTSHKMAWELYSLENCHFP